MTGSPRRRWPLLLTVAVVAIAAAIAGGVVALAGDDTAAAPKEATRTAATPQRVQPLHSRPDLAPPSIDVNKSSPEADPGLMLVAPKKVFGAREVPGEQQGPMLVDDDGKIRWFHPLPEGEEPYDFRVQRFEGKPVLTWWQGRAVRGSGKGVGLIYDTDYQPVARVETGRGAVADIHEFLITPRGTAVMLIYESGIERDLTSIGGEPDAKVVDGVIQEIDIATGEVLFEWSGLDHIDPAESHEPLDKLYIDSWDYLHFNAVDVDENGDFLVTARHTWAVYKIDRETGEIVWRLGGKRDDFGLDREARFSWPHDARFEGDDRVRIFDNAAASEPVRPESRVVTYDLDPEAGTADLVETIEHPEGLSAGTQANAQLLPSGHTVVGWGSQGHFSEFDQDGEMLFDARVQRGYDSYRAYREQWTGTPLGDPALAVEREDGATTAYVSWNGSTEVQAWQLLTGSSEDELKPAGEPVDWEDLETAIPVEGSPEYVAVRALDADGRTIGRSRATTPVAAD